MMTFMIGAGILVILLGIVALFVPALARYINFPGNERVKAIGTIIVGIIISVIGYFYG